MDIGLNGGHWMLLTHRGVERQGAYETHFNHKPKIYRTCTRTREKKREKGNTTLQKVIKIQHKRATE